VYGLWLVFMVGGAIAPEPGAKGCCLQRLRRLAPKFCLIYSEDGWGVLQCACRSAWWLHGWHGIVVAQYVRELKAAPGPLVQHCASYWLGLAAVRLALALAASECCVRHSGR
jgi:hypothetical protein